MSPQLPPSHRPILFFVVNLLLLFSGVSLAETIVIGEVYDKYSKQPLANVQIYFKNSMQGTTTNEEGLFMLRTSDEKATTLVISMLGYKKEQYKIKHNSYVRLHTALQEQSTALMDVFVLAGANPALDLMEKVRAHRNENNLQNRNEHSEWLVDETHLFLSDIEKKSLERRLWRSLQRGTIVSEDSTLLIPLYSSEKQYTLRRNKKELIETTSERQPIISESDFTVLLGGIDEHINFYQNTVSIFGKNFISPLANSGNTYYKYFLVDSLATARGKKYVIRFQSNNPRNLAFQGEFSIDSASYALQEMRATIPHQSSINYINTLRIQQQYSEEPYTPFALKQESISLLFDFRVIADSTKRIFPTVLLTRHSTSLMHSEELPEKSLSTEKITAAMDTLTNTPLIRFAKWTANIMSTGYANLGYMDVGRVVQLFSVSQPEWLRLGVPLRTSEKLMKHLTLEGYAAYGFKDAAWKYMGRMQYRLPTARRHSFLLSYTDDYVRTEMSNFDLFLRENTIGRGNMDIAPSLLTIYDYYSTMARKREALFSVTNDWSGDVETVLSVRAGRVSYGHREESFFGMPSFRYNSASLTGRFSFDERVVDLFFKRIHLYNHLPVIHVQVEAGNFKMNNGDAYKPYAKLNLMVRQRVSMGMAGSLHYLVQGGYIVGDVPYPLLQLMHGNRSAGYDSYKFNLMNNFEFVADAYVLLHTDWNMNGLLFNRIPGINRLNLHELISLRAAYGSCRASHNSVLSLSEMKSLQEPYVEAGVGVGNIFRVINIHSVWRLTNRHAAAPLWSIKVQLALGL